MRSCFTCNEDYYRTFDNKEYNFGGTCRYTLAKVKDQFEVQVDMTNCTDDTCEKVIISETQHDKTNITTWATGETSDLLEEGLSPTCRLYIKQNEDIRLGGCP